MQVLVDDYKELLELYNQLDTRGQQSFLLELEGEIVHYIDIIISKSNAKEIVEILNEKHDLNYEKC